MVVVRGVKPLKIIKINLTDHSFSLRQSDSVKNKVQNIFDTVQQISHAQCHSASMVKMFSQCSLAAASHCIQSCEL